VHCVRSMLRKSSGDARKHRPPVKMRTRLYCVVPGSEKTCYVPVLVRPALVLLDVDLDSVAELALGDLDLSAFTLSIDASCTVVGRCFWEMVSLSREYSQEIEGTHRRGIHPSLIACCM
jgi:hypothetical protein